jgi:uncharacterized protein (TIGR02284 family)
VKKIPGARTVFNGYGECCKAGQGNTHNCRFGKGYPMNYRYTIVTLRELLAVAREGELGFVTCAEHVRSESLRRLFLTRAGRHALAAAELRGLIGQLGGDPSMSGKILSTPRRAWVSLSDTLRQNNDEALVDECERGEDHALEIYRNALDDHLPEFVRQVVLRQFEGLMSDHDEIRVLRNNPLQGGLVAASTGGHARQ